MKSLEARFTKKPKLGKRTQLIINAKIQNEAPANGIGT